MSDIDDLEDDGAGGAAIGAVGEAVGAGAAAAVATVACLSCGGAVGGPFCPQCGQKNDDLRRSSVLLARDFVEDTFSFDSRMWRTLGLLAVAPGLVPKEYAHGRRSRYTPPVRLFLVVSFLFFLTIALTNTLFVALHVGPAAGAPDAAASELIVVDADADAATCNASAALRFFVKEKDLNIDRELVAECFANAQSAVSAETAKALDERTDPSQAAVVEAKNAEENINRIFGGAGWAIANPRDFNDNFNDWLPRVLLFMTPVLALILAMFIRGKEALLFDHLVLALYLHAGSFAIIGLCLVLSQVGAPLTGPAAAAGIALYYLLALKRAYGRGWIKTVWTAIASGLLYLTILMSIMLAIIVNVVLRAAS